MNESPSDEELVRRWQREPGSRAGRAAAEELFARYETRVYAWCRRVVKHHERALDLAHDALLAAFRGLAGFESRSRFSSWLFTITRHACLRELERHRETVEVEPHHRVDEDLDPEREFGSREELVRVLEVVETCLDEQERLVMWLRCEQGLPVDEITRRLDLRGASGARGVLQTARRKLHSALRERDGQARGGPS